MEGNFEWYKDGVRAIMKERASYGDQDSDNGLESPGNNGILCFKPIAPLTTMQKVALP